MDGFMAAFFWEFLGASLRWITHNTRAFIFKGEKKSFNEFYTKGENDYRKLGNSYKNLVIGLLVFALILFLIAYLIEYIIYGEIISL
ncbi:hypothetical protein [Gracilimonas sp.]|uniref:hypothetical protein n=1 Tax=Gracilimonas sp. TaxID=1974203 RepID=UPI003D0BAAED